MQSQLHKNVWLAFINARLELKPWSGDLVTDGGLETQLLNLIL